MNRGGRERYARRLDQQKALARDIRRHCVAPRREARLRPSRRRTLAARATLAPHGRRSDHPQQRNRPPQAVTQQRVRQAPRRRRHGAPSTRALTPRVPLTARRVRTAARSAVRALSARGEGARLLARAGRLVLPGVRVHRRGGGSASRSRGTRPAGRRDGVLLPSVRPGPEVPGATRRCCARSSGRRRKRRGGGPGKGSGGRLHPEGARADLRGWPARTLEFGPCFLEFRSPTTSPPSPAKGGSLLTSGRTPSTCWRRGLPGRVQRRKLEVHDDGPPGAGRAAAWMCAQVHEAKPYAWSALTLGCHSWRTSIGEAQAGAATVAVRRLALGPGLVLRTRARSENARIATLGRNQPRSSAVPARSAIRPKSRRSTTQLRQPWESKAVQKSGISHRLDDDRTLLQLC